jgi:hypothetical protein
VELACLKLLRTAGRTALEAEAPAKLATFGANMRAADIFDGMYGVEAEALLQMNGWMDGGERVVD